MVSGGANPFPAPAEEHKQDENMKRKKVITSIAPALTGLVMLFLTSCQSDELTGTDNGQPVPLTLSALLQAEGDVQTRAANPVLFTLSGSAPFSITLEKSLPHGGSGSSIVQTGEYNVDATLGLTTPAEHASAQRPRGRSSGPVWHPSVRTPC